MNKPEFLRNLAAELGALPRLEVEKTVAYYSEIIDDRCEDGMTEADAVASLEDVKTIAEKIICDTPMQVLVKERIRKPRTVTPLIIVLLIVGFPVWLPLLITVASVILAVFIALWAVIISLFAAVFSVAASGVAAAVAGFAMLTGDLAKGIFLVGAGFVCLGLAVFAFFGVAAVARLCARLIRLVWRGIKRAFVKKEDKK